MSSISKVLYVGVTSDLEGRVWQHKQKTFKGFTARYNVSKLVYYEEYDNISDAIYREKVLKGWTRKKKMALIEENNKIFADLAAEWYVDLY